MCRKTTSSARRPATFLPRSAWPAIPAPSAACCRFCAADPHPLAFARTLSRREREGAPRSGVREGLFQAGFAHCRANCAVIGKPTDVAEHRRARSSTGQSRPLITVWLQVRVLPGPPPLECTLQISLREDRG